MPVRIGVVGVGTFGINHLRAFRQASREGAAELLAAADLNPDRLEAMCREFGIRGYQNYREMLEKEALDAVSVATPDHLHGEIVVTALEAGKHVLVEKPLDVTVAGCERMLAAAQAAGRLLEVDFH